MKQTINFYDFERAFVDCDRRDNFSYQGLRVLFDYLEELEDSLGEQIELDVIGLCCDFEELRPEDIAANYGLEQYEGFNADDVYEFLEENTAVCGTTAQGTIVFQVF